MSRADDQDFPVEAVDHLAFAVGNARQSAHFYATAFGMRVTAYRGPETGTDVGAHVATHGDGVTDIALRVPDAAHAFSLAVSRGAAAVQEPTVSEDDSGKVVVARITTYGSTVHSFVQRGDYSGVFLPG